MTVEIERKFLVDKNLWNSSQASKAYKIIQAYVHKDNEKVIRLRVRNDEAFLTIKGKTQGISRLEFEYPIPVSDAQLMISEFASKCIEKTRYIVELAGKTWEVDEFEGNNKGLILAEIELQSEDEVFEKPVWCSEEVSTDFRYHNSNLIDFPMNE